MRIRILFYSHLFSETEGDARNEAKGGVENENELAQRRKEEVAVRQSTNEIGNMNATEDSKAQFVAESEESLIL